MKKKTKLWLGILIGLALLIGAGYGVWITHKRAATPHCTPINVVDVRRYHFSDVNKTHLSIAKKVGITPFKGRKDVKTDRLVKIATCEEYKVDHLTHSVPYLTPNAKALLEDIAKGFQEELKEKGYRKHRIIVTSVLRTEEDVNSLRKKNPNATKDSAHRYGTTFDITYIRFQRQSTMGCPIYDDDMFQVLGKVLKQLRDQGRCYIKYEVSQHCFHIISRK